MDHVAFIAAHNHRPVWLLDDPATNNKQCVALFWKYNQGHKDETYSAAAAEDLWTKVDWATWEKIPTSQAAVGGDWCIWSGSHGAYRNFTPSLGRGAGHVAMFVSDNGDGTGQFFSQNPGNANVITLSYDGIIGYLRPKGVKMAYFISGLASELRKQGVKVVEEPGWKTRGFANRGITRVGGVMWHHTATGRSAYARSAYPTRNIVVYGHAGLAGPLCHLLFDRDGVTHLVAAGWANHAGTGKWTDIPWHRGNDHTIGVEVESSGVYPWDLTAAQLKWIPVLGAALRKIFAINNDMSHAEYSDAGKIDLAGYPGGWDGMRRDITRVYNRGSGATAPKPTPVPAPGPKKDGFDMATVQEVTEGVWDVPVGLTAEKHQTGTYLLRTHDNTETLVKQNRELLGLLETQAAAISALAKTAGLDPVQVQTVLDTELAAAIARFEAAWDKELTNLGATVTFKNEGVQ